MKYERTYRQEHGTTVHIGHSILADGLVAAAGPTGAAWVVADERVWPLVGPVPVPRLGGVRLMPGGEGAKSFDSWRAVLEWLARSGAKRRDVLVAIGGSTISDLVGFVASSYLRGVRYVNVPTTLLAQADGAVGGKVAINLADAKNSVGAFHHPSHVLADVALLRTLPPAELRTGMAEVVKVALAEPSGELLSYIESRDIEELDWVRVVSAAVAIKLALVDPDPFEDDLRRVLNFGHTVAHALETASGYGGITHGMAVAIGLATACRYGLASGITPPELSARLHAVLSRLGLPTSVPWTLHSEVLAQLDGVRRARDGRLLYVVPRAVGEFEILDDADLRLLEKSL